jgi:hypothetical protein
MCRVGIPVTEFAGSLKNHKEKLSEHQINESKPKKQYQKKCLVS